MVHKFKFKIDETGKGVYMLILFSFVVFFAYLSTIYESSPVLMSVAASFAVCILKVKPNSFSRFQHIICAGVIVIFMPIIGTLIDWPEIWLQGSPSWGMMIGYFTWLVCSIVSNFLSLFFDGKLSS